MAKHTKYVTFSGKCLWAKLDTPDTKFNPDGKWSITLYPNTESYNKLLELKKEGIRNVVKMDDDGPYVSWSRPCQKTIKGKVRAFAPPEIIDKDGTPLPRSTRIGNGSDVTVNIEVYYFQTPQKTEGVAARLISVRIDNLVPYSRDDFDAKQQKAVAALDTAPPQLF